MTKDLLPKDVLVRDFDVLFPATDDQSSLLVRCARSDYSASILSRAVEDCQAQVLNLNVTSISDSPSHLIVALRINHRNPQAVVRSLERYGYDVVSALSGSEEENEMLRLRAKEVLRYLEI